MLEHKITLQNTELNTNSSSEQDQLSIFDIEGVDNDWAQQLQDYIVSIDDINIDDNFSDWQDSVTIPSATFNFEWENPRDGDVTITKNGAEIKVGDMLLQLEDKLDSIIAKINMIEESLENDYPALKDLPSVDTLIEQRQLIDILKRDIND